MNDLLTVTDQPYFLYADDDEDDLLLLSDTLKEISPSSGVYVYNSGLLLFAALESIPMGKKLPGLIIVDLNMPKWSGLDTLDAIKRNEAFREIPVIVFSNSDHPKHQQLSLEKGAVLYITKPYSAKDLRTTCLQFINYLKTPIRLK